MTTKIIDTYDATTKGRPPNNTNYIITAGGGFEFGIYAKYNFTVANDGRVSAISDYVLGTLFSGIEFHAGGSLTNGSPTYTGAFVESAYGVKGDTGGGSVSIANFATIKGEITGFGGGSGIVLDDGGVLTNGAPGDRVALVEGVQGIIVANAQGTVANYGAILGQGPGSLAAVQFKAGGAVTNGSAGDVTALIQGGVGVNLGALGDVNNFGAIAGSADQGVVLYGSGIVTNGAVTDTGASIRGVSQGVGIADFGTVTNYGGISASGAASTNDGVELNSGGTVTNGRPGDATAFIQGDTGVYLGGTGSVANFGAIVGSGAYGVKLHAAGNVTNGAATDTAAAISGYSEGVWLQQSGDVTNFGAIAASGVNQFDAGVELASTGTVTNGATGDLTAKIQGVVGVSLGGLGSLANFGAITGSANQGVVLYGGGNVTNGAVSDTGASITGDFQGVGLAQVGTVRNFGAIAGTGATASNTGAELNEGGSLFNGAATDLKATISGYTGVLLGGSGKVTNFGAIDGLGASFGEFGVALMAGGGVYNGGYGGIARTALIEGDSGVVIKSATGFIVNGGTILGPGDFGAALYAGGYLRNGSLTDSGAVIEGYTGAALVGGSATNFGVISSAADYGIAVALESGASLTNGAAGHAGALVEGWVGADVEAGASTVTNFGTIVGQGGTAVEFASSTDVLVVEAGSRFIGNVSGAGDTLDLASGTGTLSGLKDGAVTVSGSMAATTFDAFDIIEVAAGAKFTDTGAASLQTSDSLIASGTLTLAAVTNGGTLSAAGGALTVTGAVTGIGHVDISSGIADFGAAFTENVFFTATTGELKLGSSKTYTGKISGFSKTGTTSLDLLDIAFTGTTTAHYSGTTTSGVLTVTEGANTAKITLEGNYLASTFTLSAAPGGGTLVVDPPRTAMPGHAINPAPQGFIAAMAGFIALGGGSVGVGGEAWRTPPPTLVAPRPLA